VAIERGRQLRRPHENQPIGKRASDDGRFRVDGANPEGSGCRATDRYLNFSIGELFLPDAQFRVDGAPADARPHSA
jgi:hypothetical protein